MGASASSVNDAMNAWAQTASPLPETPIVTQIDAIDQLDAKAARCFSFYLSNLENPL